jgi:hypothetical protein
MVSECRPLAEKVTESHLACGSFRSRNVSLCPLVQTVVEGRMNAAAAEIGFGFALPDATVPAARAVPTATDIAATASAMTQSKDFRCKARARPARLRRSDMVMPSPSPPQDPLLG